MMDHSHTFDPAMRSWTELAKVLDDTALFDRGLFTLPGGRYRGTPPVVVLRRAFPNFEDVQKAYREHRAKSQNDEDAFKKIRHLLVAKPGVIKDEDMPFWIAKVEKHLKKLTNKIEADKRKREGLTLWELERKQKNNDTQFAMKECASFSPSPDRPSVASIEDFAVAAEAQSENSSTLVTYLKCIEHDPTALANFLSTERTNLLPNVKPFIDGLRSGRLRPLKDAKLTDWEDNVPQLFCVKDVCPGLDLEAVWGTAITHIRQGTVYEAHRNGQPLEFEPKFVSAFCRGTSVGYPKYVVNIPLGNIKLYLPQHIQEHYTVYQQEDEDSVFLAQANIGTFGSVVDIHDGNASALIA
jgi:hypothetical protein